jgi:hypothetical protein
MPEPKDVSIGRIDTARLKFSRGIQTAHSFKNTARPWRERFKDRRPVWLF